MGILPVSDIGEQYIEIALPKLHKLEKPIKIGLITDLHHDVMHDGFQRLDAFLKAMKAEQPDAIMQLGHLADGKEICARIRTRKFLPPPN